MHLSYDTNAPKRPVNLTANSDLINMVRNENGNLSKLFEQSMISFLAEKELVRWKEESKTSFESYNKMIAERGTVSEELGLLL